MDSMNDVETTKVDMSCEMKGKFPDRIHTQDDIPQTEEMVAISSLKDDQGKELPNHIRESITNGTTGAIVISANGKLLFLQPYVSTAQGVEEVKVPSSAFYVRDEVTQEPILRLAAVGGGSG